MPYIARSNTSLCAKGNATTCVKLLCVNFLGMTWSEIISFFSSLCFARRVYLGPSLKEQRNFPRLRTDQDFMKHVETSSENVKHNMKQKQRSGRLQWSANLWLQSSAAQAWPACLWDTQRQQTSLHCETRNLQLKFSTSTQGVSKLTTTSATAVQDGSSLPISPNVCRQNADRNNVAIKDAKNVSRYVGKHSCSSTPPCTTWRRHARTKSLEGTWHDQTQQDPNS